VTIPAAGLLSLFGVQPGGGGVTAPVSDAIPALRRVRAPGAEARGTERLAREPETARVIDSFRKAIAGARDLDTALRDPRVQAVLLPALGLSDAAGQNGLILRALKADPAERDGLLSRLSDTRWRDAARTLDLGRRGLAGLRDGAVQQRLAEGFTQFRWRQAQDRTTPGVADALYFQGRAPEVRDVFNVLGDPVLRRVVTGALGLPEQLAIQPVETQARAITSRLPIEKLRDPREVQRLAERYVLNRAQSAAPAQPASPLLSLFA
jgi:hypothetical protein